MGKGDNQKSNREKKKPKQEKAKGASTPIAGAIKTAPAGGKKK